MRPRAEVFLLAAAALAAELALTRVASFLLQYHYNFAAVGMAIGGLGLGTALAAWRPGASPATRGAAALGSAVLFTAALGVGRIAGGTSIATKAVLLSITSILAFATLGWALGLALEACRKAARSAYARNAVGAAVGTVGAVAALEAFGPGGAFAVAVAAALGAAGLAVSRLGLRVALAVAALGLGWALCALEPGVESAPVEAPLGLRLARGGRAIEGRWDAYARSDLVAAEEDLGFEEIYGDGTAPAMIVLRAGEPEVAQAHRRELPYLPYVLRRPARVLSLGGGAGYDAWLARLAAAREIDVVEINRATLELAASRTGTSADALRAPGVRLFHGDGRRFLRRHGERYDLIVLALYQGEADARASIALREASGYTSEAVAAYLEHLTPTGRVAVLLHDRALIERLWRSVEAVLGESGSILAFEHPPSAPYRYLLYFGGGALDRTEHEVLRAVEREGRFHPVGRLRVAGLDLSPTTDERPFFFHTEGAAPRTLWLLVVLPLLAALGLALRRGRAQVPRAARLVALLSGVGFSSLELLLVERFLPGVGFPVVALAVVAAGMLVGSAQGALLGRRLTVAAAATALVVLAILGGLLGSAARDVGALPFWLAGAVALLVSAAAGFFAGRPLPAALEAAAAEPGGVARLWAIASLAAVAGSALFTLLALHWGYGIAAALPAMAYAALALVGRRLPSAG